MEDVEINDSPEKDIAGKHIMWVEDDLTLNDIINRWLSRYDCTLSSAVKGQEALDKMRSNPPDILLLDILLPDTNGFEILKEMRNDENLKDVPVILFSNLNQQDDIDKGFDLGASRFMVKSTVFLDNLVKEIRNVLREHGKL